MDLKCIQIHVCVHPQRACLETVTSDIGAAATQACVPEPLPEYYCFREPAVTAEVWDWAGRCHNLKMGWPCVASVGQGRPPHKDIVTCVSGACSTSPIPPTPSIPSFDHAKPAMNLDPMLTSCAVKEHDPLDYILLPLPKMSSFMIGVTALLWPGRWNGCKLLRRQASAWRRRTWR